MRKESESIHLILGAALALIAIFLITGMVLVQSQAVDVNTGVLVENAAPTVESVYINNVQFVKSDGYPAGTINSLVAGGVKTLYINGVVQDLNGNVDLVGVSMVFYRSSVPAGSDCVADKNECYRVASCDTQTNGDSDQWDYSCSFQLSYFADSTSVGGVYLDDNWIAKVFVSDELVEGEDQTTKEVQTLLALSVPSSIDYGTLSMGQETTSENNQALVITQSGNDEADVELSADSDMACSGRGSIPVSNQQWSLTDVGYDGSGVTELSGIETDTDLYVEYQTNESVVPTRIVYWNIAIPANGLEGTCVGITTIAALSH